MCSIQNLNFRGNREVGPLFNRICNMSGPQLRGNREVGHILNKSATF